LETEEILETPYFSQLKGLEFVVLDPLDDSSLTFLKNKPIPLDLFEF
jgi:hypothetical protein